MIITLTIFLFLCGIAGFILNRNNVILLIVAIELLLLAVPSINSCFTNKGPKKSYSPYGGYGTQPERRNPTSTPTCPCSLLQYIGLWSTSTCGSWRIPVKRSIKVEARQLPSLDLKLLKLERGLQHNQRNSTIGMYVILRNFGCFVVTGFRWNRSLVLPFCSNNTYSYNTAFNFANGQQPFIFLILFILVFLINFNQNFN